MRAIRIEKSIFFPGHTSFGRLAGKTVVSFHDKWWQLEGNFQQSQTHTDRWQLRANCIYFCFVRCFFSPSFLGMELHRTLWQRVEAPEMRHQGLIPSPNLLLSHLHHVHHLHSSVFVEAELNATAGRNELNCICTTN